MKLILILILVLLLSLGCGGVISRHGVATNLGQGSVTMCDETCTDEADCSCTVLEGAAISVPGSQIFSGLITLAAGLTMKIFGVPVPAVEATE